ncbi:hypothetical protein GCM10009677_24880 [Sphaerisporangium rubeum]|uniref:OLD protein-like TOPRIM domain-containing protein n=1 Tax=Sphaerisporangium rubeum TaxID=321317 RepID=A0A7X0M4F1_9ACTN|nr:TOPRIM nucleotidyl transferase/hydrolase domain-containing protein [Sphaerisporangium rubeum]MBB6471200.1 hypothetical protein [Sphaerisporangium rubeum]
MIVVEGHSDLAYFMWLRSMGLLDGIGANVGVLDAHGKFELHRAATTLSLFRIPHVVVWDGDAHGRTGDDLKKVACRDEAAWQALRAAANDPRSTTVGGIRLAGALEKWLGVHTEQAPAWKSGSLVAELDQHFHVRGSSVRDRSTALVAAIADLFDGKTAAAHADAAMFADCLFAPPFPQATVDFAAELASLPILQCRCRP